MVRSASRLVFASALLAASSACAPLAEPLLAKNARGVVEPVYAAAVYEDTAIIRISSNGCTRKSDMYPELSRGGGITILTVRRQNEDRCDAPSPDVLDLKWSFEELGLPAGTAVTVNNPLKLRSLDDSDLSNVLNP